MSTATPSATSGTARAVLRSASPKLDDDANDLKRRPSTDGSSYGFAPTEITKPTNVTSTKNARCRHRTMHAAAKANSGSAYPTAMSQRSCV